MEEEPSNSASAAEEESDEDTEKEKEQLRQRIESLREKENYDDEVWQTFFVTLHFGVDDHLR